MDREREGGGGLKRRQKDRQKQMQKECTWEFRVRRIDERERDKDG